jgi:hypothetical protein
MPQSQIGDAASIIPILLIVLGSCFGFINALFFFILNRIKKNIDSLWTKRNSDHDRIIAIETRNDIKDGKK